jgi:exosortase/archaeosortase
MSNTDNNIEGRKAGLESRNYLRLILQGLAVVGGLWGLFAIYCGIHFIVLGYTNSSKYAMRLVNTLMFLAMGGYLLMTAYLMVRKFSAGALKHFSAIVALIFFGFAFRYLEPIAEKVRQDKAEMLHIFIGLLPFLCLVVVYRICTKLLIRLTKAPNDQKQ